MDEVDVANDQILKELDLRIAEVRSASARPSPENCERCNDPISPTRRALNLRLCIDCAQLKERQQRMFARY